MQTTLFPAPPKATRRRTKQTSIDQEFTLTGEKLDLARHLIRDLYLRYKQPWIIGMSQGKDSTAAAQLVWEAIAELLPKQRLYPIYFVMGDTRSETPHVQARIVLTKRLIEQAAAEQDMPASVIVAEPTISEGLLVRMIGYGYAAPTVKFRWCVERAKIKPINRVVQSIAPTGRAIQVLGSRTSESSNRAASIAKFETGTEFSTSPTGVKMYLPLKDWTTSDIWTYLSQVSSPWGGLRYNLDLRAMYKQDAEGGECPLVIDKSQPACGSGRFGCWHCSVTETNRSLYAFVDDNDWAWPLVEIYEYLANTTVPANKAEYRDPKILPNGSIKMLDRDPVTAMPGKYKFAIRKLLLEMMLRAQRDMRRDGPDSNITLLRVDDLRAIRHLWMQHNDYPHDGSDPAREIAVAFGIDLSDYHADDARLLDLPAIPQSGEQLTMMFA